MTKPVDVKAHYPSCPDEAIDVMQAEIERQDEVITTQAAEIKRLRDAAEALERIEEIAYSCIALDEIQVNKKDSFTSIRRIAQQALEINRMTDAIEKAPHSESCATAGVWPGDTKCNCWKAALKEQDNEDISGFYATHPTRTG